MLRSISRGSNLLWTVASRRLTPVRAPRSSISISRTSSSPISISRTSLSPISISRTSSSPISISSSSSPISRTSSSPICGITGFQQRSLSNRDSEGFYNHAVNETLESLSDKISELIDDNSELEGADITLSDGVLTVNFGHKHGIYVINKQTPNKQVWMSSPLSGPMRFDLVPGSEEDSDTWVYSHTGQSLHQVLDKELGTIFNIETNFQRDCFMGGAKDS